jgi:hypothetical protein
VVFYRVLYSSERWATVEGEAGLQRALARKAPRVIYHMPATTYRCQACPAAGPWGDGWVAWERYNARHQLRGEGPDIYCSMACCRAQNPEAGPPHWMDTNEEPVPVECRRAAYQALREERARKKSMNEHRQCPMPDWPGDKHCRWCALPLDPAVDGKARSWHAACVPVYFQHTRLDDQLAFLLGRDGRRCGMPGCTATHGLEVDHKVPLWSVDQTLPLEQLRFYYGPGNLWLLCPACHKAKTKREAAERAAQRRFAAAQPALPL